MVSACTGISDMPHCSYHANQEASTAQTESPHSQEGGPVSSCLKATQRKSGDRVRLPDLQTLVGTSWVFTRLASPIITFRLCDAITSHALIRLTRLEQEPSS